jgi:hypothetical protein
VRSGFISRTGLSCPREVMEAGEAAQIDFDPLPNRSSLAVSSFRPVDDQPSCAVLMIEPRLSWLLVFLSNGVRS